MRMRACARARARVCVGCVSDRELFDSEPEVELVKLSSERFHFLELGCECVG